MMGPEGAAIAPALQTLAGYYADKESGDTVNKLAGMARDEGLMTQDTLEKFINLPQKQRATAFDFWSKTMLPVQANRMKVQDQAQIWNDYRNDGSGAGPQSRNKYGYRYQGAQGP
jgi:hypothetical protein